MSRRGVCVRCGHTSSVHNLHSSERLDCIVSKCGCPVYRAPAPPSLLDRVLAVVVAVAENIPPVYGRRR